jgi:orotidine-5'-phosphate decarboxylase
MMSLKSLFGSSHGIIPAADVADLDRLESLVRETATLECVVGYKIGCVLSVKYGLSLTVQAIRKWTDLPVIYDHQKFGGDIPDIVSGDVLSTFKEAGVAAVIIFPHGGIETLRAAIRGCDREGLIPILGGEMTHSGYLLSEGGYIADDAPERMYLDAAHTGMVHYFIVPGTKPEHLGLYSSRLASVVPDPAFLLPGIGKGQGGDIVEAFRALEPHHSYAIVGRGIYAEPDKRAAAERLWSSVAQAGLG